MQKKNNIENKKELKVDKEILKKEFIFSQEKQDIENLSKKLEGYNNHVKKLHDKISNCRSIVINSFEEHIYVNEYRELIQEIPLSILAIIGFVQALDNSTKMVYESVVSRTLSENFKKMDLVLKDFPNKIDSKIKAKKLTGGKYKVLLHPHLTGLLAHESFGHGMEADTMLKDRALASSLIGEKIGSDFINIVDYPAIEGKHGEYYFDHDGNLANKTYLVKNGIINQPMADIYSKTNLGLDKSSNSRMEAFDHKNYTRMSNTYFEPGTRSFEDLIKEIDDGIFITDSSGGMEDPKGWGVQIQGNFGQRIKDGKLIDEYYDGFTLTGFLPDIIKHIKEVSKEFEIEGGGRCGKGHKEWVRVSEGGPYMLINEIILG